MFAFVALAVAASQAASPDNVVPESLPETRHDVVSALNAAIKEHGEHSMSPHAIRTILAGAVPPTESQSDRVMDDGEAERYKAVRNDENPEALWAVCDCGAVCFNFVLGGKQVCSTISMALDDTLRMENDTRHATPCVYKSDHLTAKEDPKCIDYNTLSARASSVLAPLVGEDKGDAMADVPPEQALVDTMQ